MKALSLWQPWATLWLGPKRYETRSWSTPYRGMLVVHAARRWGGEQQALAYSEPMVSLLEAMGTSPNSLARGAYVGLVGLKECFPAEAIVPRGVEAELGDFTEGRWVWARGGAVVFREPIPARGQQRLWTPSKEEREQILRQVRAAVG